MIGLLVGVPLSLIFMYLAVRGLHPGEVADALRGADPLPVVGAVALIGAYLLGSGGALALDHAPLGADALAQLPAAGDRERGREQSHPGPARAR